MAIHIFSTIVSERIPSGYYLPIALVIVLLAVVHAYAQGRRTNRDRDLHARTVILTGAFTPLGLTLLEFLAKKGAHVIALVPTPSLTSHHAEILSLLRSSTSNECIYAEPCSLESPAAIKKFCERFVNTENEKDRRVDALIMAHEYTHIGTWSIGTRKTAGTHDEESMKRDEGAMATFLLTTLLLPALLVAPIDRDIRIINIVNPFYAAAAPNFIPRLSSATYNPTSPNNSRSNSKLTPDSTSTQQGVVHSPWILEGQRALRMAVFTRHLQRILDALPDPGSAPAASSTGTSLDSAAARKAKSQKSNILAVTVSPGISRTDTVASYFLSSLSAHGPSAVRQWTGAILYIILLPALYLLAKTPTSALQSVLHVLCVPKPLTRRRVPVAEDFAQAPPAPHPQTPPHDSARTNRDVEEEVLVPGALYTDCSVVRPHLHVPESISEGSDGLRQDTDSEQYELGLGKEPLGRAVWEALENGIKVWESREGGEGKAPSH